MRHIRYFGEQGSMAPIGIGLALMSLALTLSILSSGSLYVTERRLTWLAEASALAVLIESEGDFNQPLGPLAKNFLELSPSAPDIVRLEVSSSDQRTVRVRLCSNQPPLFAGYPLVSEALVCSEGLARFGR